MRRSFEPFLLLLALAPHVERCAQRPCDSPGYLSNSDCGACGNACPPSAPQVRSYCGSNPDFATRDERPVLCVWQCYPGWGDCDGDRANGCETSLATSENCGRCGRGCSPSQTCAWDDPRLHSLPSTRYVDLNWHCALPSCPPGRGDCDEDPSNGCEADLAADRNHCSVCRRRCAFELVCQDGDCACPEGTSRCGEPCFREDRTCAKGTDGCRRLNFYCP